VIVRNKSQVPTSSLHFSRDDANTINVTLAATFRRGFRAVEMPTATTAVMHAQLGRDE
jgi:hypothetical protein